MTEPIGDDAASEVGAGVKPGPAAWATPMEIAAVLLLVIGGLAFLPAWVAGVVLLWASPRWQLSDRLLGTLIWPGGLAAVRFLLLRSAFYQPRFRTGFSSQGAFFVTAQPHPIVRLLILAVLSVPPALVAIRLLRRAR